MFDRLIGLLSLLEQLGTKRMHWRVKKQPFTTYFEANLAVMSRMQQDSSEILGFACEFEHYDFFNVVHLSMPTLVRLFCYVEV